MKELSLRQKTILSLIVCTGIISIIIITGFVLMTASTSVNFALVNQPPSKQAFFGTDWAGRDMLSRTLQGAALSLIIGFSASVISVTIAVIFSALAQLNHWLETIVNWIIDLFLSVPHLLLLLFISFLLGGGIQGIIIGIGVTHWPALARLLSVEMSQLKKREYVLSARKFGKSETEIILRHLLPQAGGQILLGGILLFPHAILHEAAITFLGFGLPSNTPAIGVILSESMSYLTAGAWWLATFPGVMLLTLVLLVQYIGKLLSRYLYPSLHLFK